MYFIEIIGHTINTMKSLLFIGNMLFLSVSELIYYLFYKILIYGYTCYMIYL